MGIGAEIPITRNRNQRPQTTLIAEFVELPLVAANVGSAKSNAGRGVQMQVHLQVIRVWTPG